MLQFTKIKNRLNMNEIKMLESIKEYINNLYSLDIDRDTRKREYVDARAFYYKLCKELTKCSLATIGESVGRDHSGVIHSLNNIVQYLDEEEIEKAYAHFGLVENLPKESYSYLEYKNIQLSNDLKKKEAVLRLIPKLEDIYNNLNILTDDQKQTVDVCNELQFDTINRCLNRVQGVIEAITE